MRSIILFCVLGFCCIGLGQDTSHRFGDGDGHNWMRWIYSSDMSIKTLVPGVPIQYLTQDQKLPLVSIPQTADGRVELAINFTYEIKPANAGTIEIPNSLKPHEAYFVPSDTFHSMGLVNATAENARGETIIGQIHFIVRKSN